MRHNLASVDWDTIMMGDADEMWRCFKAKVEYSQMKYISMLKIEKSNNNG